MAFFDSLGRLSDTLYQAQINANRFDNPLEYMQADDRRQVLRERQAAREAILQNPQALGQLNKIVPNAEQYLRAGGDLESLGKLRTMTLGTDRPAAIQEHQYYLGQPEDQRNIFSGLQGRATVTDLGDRYVMTDRVTGEQREIMKAGQEPRTPQTPVADIIPQITENVDYIDDSETIDLVPDPTMIATPQFGGQKGIPPEQDPEFKRKQAEQTAIGTEVGKEKGIKEALLAEYEANLPELEKTIGDLSKLSETATYTMAGNLADNIIKQAGFGSTSGAVDKAEYIARVDNVVLPLLRQTFGAAFTKAEGDTLRATLGDPDASPEEKEAKLRAFIEQKYSAIRSAQRYLGKPVTGEGKKAPLKYNPDTGDFE